MTIGKHIAVDLDDVILDFVGGIRRWVETEYGVEIPDESITDFNLRPFLDPIVGKNWWTAFRERDWLWPNFPAVPGAIGGLEILRHEGYYLEIVTSKPRWAEYATWKWLGKWRPPVQRVTIVGPEDRKVDFTDAVLLVDDKPSNLIEFSDEGRKGVMYARPHNQSVDLRLLGIERVDNWQEVLKEVRRLTE